MRHDDERKRGLSHRLWWLAAMMSVAVGLGIVLDPPSDAGVARQGAAPAHAGIAAPAARGG